MSLRFEWQEEWPGMYSWLALDNHLGLPNDRPYRVHRFDWFDEFKDRPSMGHLKPGQTFFTASYGWRLNSGKCQFGMHVDNGVRWYQTKQEAMNACNDDYAKQRVEAEHVTD